CTWPVSTGAGSSRPPPTAGVMNCAVQSAGTNGATWTRNGSDQGETPPSCSVRTCREPRCPLRSGSPGQGRNTDSSVTTRQVRGSPPAPASVQRTCTACCAPAPAGRSQLIIGFATPRQVASSSRSRRSWRGAASTADSTRVLSPKEVLGLTLSQCSVRRVTLTRDAPVAGWHEDGRSRAPQGVRQRGWCRDGCRWWNLPDRRRGDPELRGQGQLGRGGP